jgi:hypothetical protein
MIPITSKQIKPLDIELVIEVTEMLSNYLLDRCLVKILHASLI